MTDPETCRLDGLVRDLLAASAQVHRECARAAPHFGQIACPICARGVVDYSFLWGELKVSCTTPGCVRPK